MASNVTFSTSFGTVTVYVSNTLLNVGLKANSSSSIDIKASKDFANCYDIQIEKIKDID